MFKRTSIAKLLSSTVISTSVVLPAASVFAKSPQMIEEILVTARKREESFQDISAAVAVVDGDKLKEQGIVDIRDLQSLVPSLNVGEAIGIMKLNMRGLSNSTVVRGEDTEVVLHVDGAVISRAEAQSLAFFDLERVEVLRGPQGTLYGRNSTGGTINLITAKPTEEFTGYVNATVGNYNLTKIETAISGPLTDRVLGRVALQSVNREGYSENVAPTVGRNDFNDDKRWAARAQLQFDISDDVQFLLSGEYASQNDSSGHLTYLDSLYSGVAPTYGSDGFSNPRSRDGAFSTQPQMKRESLSVTGTLDWQLNERLSLKSITNYRDLKFFNWSDLDVSAVSYVDVGIPFDDEQVSQELQFTYLTDNLLAMVGVFYFNEEFEGSTDVYLRFASDTLFQFLGKSKTEALSPFWNVTYDFNDTWSLRAGGRLNKEDREFANASFLAGNPMASLADKKSFSEYTGEYGIDFHLTENTMFYYTFSQGFRSGAALVMQVDSPIIDPTTVDNHEIGMKYSTSDGRFTFNLSAFDAEIQDLQRSQTTAILDDEGNAIGAGLRVNNINDMETQGIEAEFSWIPTDQLRFNGSVVFLDAEFKDFLTDDPLQAGVELIQVAGNRPRQTPEWRANFQAEYDINLNNGTLTPGINMSYVDDQYFDEFNREPFVEDAYTVVDMNLTYRPADNNWSVSLWGKNLGDEKRIYDTNLSVFGQIKNKHLSPPRTYGLTATINF